MKLFLLFFIGLIHFNCIAINVTFVNPSVPGTPFWDRVTAVAKAAAEDLSINLTIVYGKDNRIYNFKAIEQVIAADNKPDYLIFMPYDGNAVNTFERLEQAKIPFVTIERTLKKYEQTMIGFPQEKFTYWLGEVFHDNVFAGKLLATELIKQAKKQQSNKNIVAIGLAGSFSGESNERTQGLELAVEETNGVSLVQVVPAIWSRERSRNIIFQLNARFGHIDIAWAASDGMALGILDSIDSGYKGLNANMIIGGVDWTEEGLKEIENGRIAASVGGHFMQTAWALIKLYDHHHGKSFFKPGDLGKTYDLEAITRDNIEQYKVLTQKVDWQQIDFSTFSLINNEKTSYDFSFHQILSSLHR
ncbi:ABC transporter substrate-binding protein [Thalassotalea sp. 1_MG-2023]|uniref:ABC transporter substrate-binding protein n=1 Tax=Thalassotalea sp. 1_MG-2023 TaxID=3062680 RepID=UPI0026E34EB0|nr:ABC transporter substrate-binding protein [Thalassotalea sp. 1_MG-2023]MDO6428596.1 ABC transporter substrate-binding protein [Thalassotalea sp. 1_MG-2023]